MSRKYVTGEEKKPPRNKNSASLIHQRAEDLAKKMNIPFYENFQDWLNNSIQNVNVLIEEYVTEYPISKHNLLIVELANLKYQNEFLIRYCELLEKEIQLRRSAAKLTQDNAKKSGKNRTKPSKRDTNLNIRIEGLKDLIQKWEMKNKRKISYSDFKKWNDDLCKRFCVSSATLKYDWYYRAIR